MIPHVDYLIWRQSDNHHPEMDGTQFFGGSDIKFDPEIRNAAGIWMACDHDHSHTQIYGERSEAWSLFHAGALSFVCRVGTTPDSGCWSHAWAWRPDSGIPCADPAMMLANSAQFPAGWQGAAPECSFVHYDPFWAPAVFRDEDSRRQCSLLLALLLDAAASGRGMVVLTSLEWNDWSAGSDLSCWVAFAVAALPRAALSAFSMRTSSPRPREAFREGASLVTYDLERNRSLTGFDPNWIVWRPDRVPGQCQSLPTEQSLRFAGAVVDAAACEPRFLPSLSRLLTMDDFRSASGARLVDETAEIARRIEPEGELLPQLRAAAAQLDNDSARTRGAVLLHREGLLLPSEWTRKLWNMESVDENWEELRQLSAPVGGGMVENLCWAECQAGEGALQSSLRRMLAEYCQVSHDELREFQALRPGWLLWTLLPLRYLVKWAPGAGPLEGERLAIVNRQWAECPVATVRELAGGNGWLRWMAGWHAGATEADRKRMAQIWFAGCEPDSLLEEWACALALPEAWTVQDIQELSESLGRLEVPPQLEYLEDEQWKITSAVGARISPAPIDPRYRAAYAAFNIDTRRWEAQLLFRSYTRLIADYAGGAM